MDLIWNPWAIPSMLVVVGALAMAILVWSTRPDRSQNRLLATYLFLEAFAFLWLSVGELVSGSQATAFAAAAVGYPIWGWVLVFYVLFISTLGTPLVAFLRHAWVRALVILAGVAITAFALFYRWFPVFHGPWYAGYGTGHHLLNRSLFIAALTISIFALVAAVSAFLRHTKGSPLRSQAKAFVAAFGIRDAGMIIFALSALFIGTAFGAGGFSLLDLSILFIWPFAVTTFHVLLALGILRTQLFDIDLKIKWTIRRSTLVAIFVGVFFVSAQVAQAFLTTEYGWAIGGIVAGVLLLAINPLQQLASHVADTAMPGVQDTQTYRNVRKREVYRAAVESALQDGVITDKERDLLAILAEQLGLKHTQARQIEREATQATRRSS